MISTGLNGRVNNMLWFKSKSEQLKCKLEEMNIEILKIDSRIDILETRANVYKDEIFNLKYPQGELRIDHYSNLDFFIGSHRNEYSVKLEEDLDVNDIVAYRYNGEILSIDFNGDDVNFIMASGNKFIKTDLEYHENINKKDSDWVNKVEKTGQNYGMWTGGNWHLPSMSHFRPF